MPKALDIERLLRNAGETVSDLAALVRTGVLRPMKPQTLAELTRRLVVDGPRVDLVFAYHALQDPDRIALVHGDARYTWRELYTRVLRLSNWMLDSGVRPGDAVAIVLPNRPEFVEAQAAAMRIGAVASLVNPRGTQEASREILERVDARLVVTHRPEVTGGRLALVVPDAYEDALASSSDSEPRVPKDAHGRMVIFTSGTTGRPKGAVRSLGGSASTSMLGLLRVIPFRHDDVHLTVCPMYHASGSGFTTMALALGNTVVIEDRFTPKGFVDAIERHRVTTTAVVPTMLHELVASREAEGRRLGSLRAVVCTGSPLREEVRTHARPFLGDVLYDLYGATEMGWVSVATPADQRRRPRSVGKPVPGVDVRILDEIGEALPTETRGEIWSGNAVAMEGYLDDAELTARRVRERYVSVGDVGYLDADGYLHVVDRIDDMIITGGVNVYPAETEVALSAHPDVREAAVLGVTDPKWGQRVVAAVVRGRPDLSEVELVSWCKELLPAAAVPKEITFVGALPRNDVGKVAKRAIADGWEDGSAREKPTTPAQN